jgi:hypothetical protein
MIARQLIHSGSFLDHEDNPITVSFYKRIDLNADPTSFDVDYTLSVNILVVWSREGEAYVKSYPSWLISCTEIWVADLPGTNYHKHYYSFGVPLNEGEARDGVFKISIQGNDWAETVVPIHQEAEPGDSDSDVEEYDLHADPESFNVDYTLSGYLLIVWSLEGEAYVKSYPAWFAGCSQVWTEDIPGSSYHKHYYSVGVTRNDGDSRDGNIVVGIEDSPLAELIVPIHQGSNN